VLSSKISNVATWWLGRADMREEMIEKLDSMVIASAFTEAPPTVAGSEILGAQARRRAAAARLSHRSAIAASIMSCRKR
jgi:uncharacterized circularly permuted ATP-grasp superfamily protein